MAKKKNSQSTDLVESLDYDESNEEDCFIDGDIDCSKHNTIASFSFTNDNDIVTVQKAKQDCSASLQAASPAPQVFQGQTLKPEPASTGLHFHAKEPHPAALIDNRNLQCKPYGKTPPVDGESFEVSRTFLFRRSTVRMLNKIKAEHPDENVYLSSIVDEALRYYYEGVFGNGDRVV